MHDDFDRTRRSFDDSPSSFTICGETMHYRPQAQAELIANYYDAMAGALGEDRNGLVLRHADELIASMLIDDGDLERWRHVRRLDSPDPLSIRDVQAIADRMLEVMVDRPTVKSSGSGTSPSSTTTPSTEDSLSTAAVA